MSNEGFVVWGRAASYARVTGNLRLQVQVGSRIDRWQEAIDHEAKVAPANKTHYDQICPAPA
jgi:hypothetical protein